MRDLIEVPDQKLWKDLPGTWSPPEPGTAYKMTMLMLRDPEYLEVERNVRKTSSASVKQIVSVSVTLLLIVVVIYANFVGRYG